MISELKLVDQIESEGWELYTRTNCRGQHNQNTSWFATREGYTPIFLSCVFKNSLPNLDYMLGQFWIRIGLKEKL